MGKPKYNIRIDPLCSDGSFDLEFFSSPDYKIECGVVCKYLYDEGFCDEVKDFKITLLDRVWWVSINNKNY